jgi:hypothetical protein
MSRVTSSTIRVWFIAQAALNRAWSCCGRSIVNLARLRPSLMPSALLLALPVPRPPQPIPVRLEARVWAI